jgi:hypothetical protein
MPILPDFAAAEFEPAAPIDNPFFPLQPGTIKSYGGSKLDDETGEAESESNDVFVTFESKAILGVQTVVVRDTAYENGVLVEDTLDWYAQDSEGNVWYFGEIAYNYRYDDEGNHLATDIAGSWTGGVDGALPGWIMRAEPSFGAGYYQEFAPGVAVDEGIVVGIDEDVSIGLGHYDGVLKTLDTTALEPDVAELKSYAPGGGEILAEEELSEEGEADLEIELRGIRHVAPPAYDANLAGSGGSVVTFLSEDAGFDNAVGAYTFDLATGEIGEGRILFAATDDVAAGAKVSVDVESGQGVGLFLLADGADLGVDLSEYLGGGLFFRNILTGASATLADSLAPLVADEDGLALPIQPLHALGNAGGFNFLNPVAGVQAVALDAAPFTRRDDVTILGFEDLRATQAGYDGDFNDVLVAVSDTVLSAALVHRLVAGLDTFADQDALLA